LLGSVQTMRVSEDSVSLGDGNAYVGHKYLVAFENHPLCISLSLKACDRVRLRTEPGLEVLLGGLHYSAHATKSAKQTMAEALP
jgi:hypothetical protein